MRHTLRHRLRRTSSGAGVLCAMLVILLLAGCGQIPVTATGEEQPSSAPAGSAVEGTRCQYTRSGEPARPVDLPPTENVPDTGTVTVTMSLNTGKITLTLDRERAPCTVNSFVSLAEQGFYDGTECPRLTDAEIYLLQCGDPTGTTGGGPGYTFPDELSGDEQYPMGTVAMANGGPNSNGSQFFLVYRDSEIAPDYTVFGEIDAQGINLLNEIAADGHDGSNSRGGGVPNNPVEISSVTIE